MGNRRANCLNGITALADLDGVTVNRMSRFYETEPVDYRDQDWFVNAAVRIQTVLNPFELLDALKEIERILGRKDTPIRFGPRMLDLDIILYDDLVLQTPKLVIPHPRMHERRFVLIPLCDIAPNAEHPVMHQNIRQLRDALRADTHQQVVDF